MDMIIFIIDNDNHYQLIALFLFEAQQSFSLDVRSASE
ncbi:hypothetical protein BSI_35490 [Bacillus inaquosorum KCTC 13429]|uniref:Uncharacterized protein n=1 Tax=Bacillus inaquosorum KCTC 13429 TaxID=1236548 RepID=A0A9W5PBS9_9BACI|nr:hypothetical protein BSI_35490 [Bacillus inaquosorum KCTC 13429]